MWLVNDSAVDIEVYCADFDKQFLVAGPLHNRCLTLPN